MFEAVWFLTRLPLIVAAIVLVADALIERGVTRRFGPRQGPR